MATIPVLNNGDEYVGSVDYDALGVKLTELKSILDDLIVRSWESRKLRYAEVDVETERDAGNVQPDELYVPQHIIDTNIRREQSSYVQFITQSPRAVILEDQDDPTVDLSLLEKDLTKKLRFPGWQLGMYSNIDNFQANGYSVMEVVYDETLPGAVGHEMVQFGDFAFVSDTRDLQACELIGREYHYTKTRLLDLSNPEKFKNPADAWDREQVNKVIGKGSPAGQADLGAPVEDRDKSLFKVQKIMFRVQGTVYVAWSCIGVADDWLRIPRPLYLGRRQLVPETPQQQMLRMAHGVQTPPSNDMYETDYPYFLYPYLISENDTISNLKGRVYLDQDVQEAVSSLISSTCTQARRAAGLYFSKDVSDPNDDLMLQKNVFFKQGCLINSKVTSFKLDAPDPGIFSAIQLLVSGNQNETSQTNFAARNRQDSRKTATELKLANQEEQSLSTVQVVLYSIALRNQYSYQCAIIKSRVLAGLLKVNPMVAPLYQREWAVKPSGDVDVMERNQLVQMMLQTWPIMSQTPAAPLFLSDLLEKLFPNTAPKYIQAMQQAEAQAQSQQAQQMQQGMQMMMGMAKGIIELSKHSDYFSDVGKLHALPVIEQAATQFEEMEKQVKNTVKAKAKQQPQPVTIT